MEAVLPPHSAITSVNTTSATSVGVKANALFIRKRYAVVVSWSRRGTPSRLEASHKP